MRSCFCEENVDRYLPCGDLKFLISSTANKTIVWKQASFPRTPLKVTCITF